MRHDGTQQLFDVDGTAAVPLTTDNGLTWAGSAAVTGEYNFHSCNGVRSDTTMSVQIVPKEFRVDPTAQTVRGDGLLSVAHAAEQLHVSPALIHVWIQQGALSSEQRM